LVLRDVIGDTFDLHANENLTFLSKLSLLYAFQAHFKHWFVYRERNDRQPNGEVCKMLVLATLLINFGRSSVIFSVGLNWVVLQIIKLFRIRVISVIKKVSTET